MEQTAIIHLKHTADTIVNEKIKNHGGLSAFVQKKSDHADDIKKQIYYCRDGKIVFCDSIHDDLTGNDFFSVYVI